MTLLRRLAKEEHKAILLSTHDIDQALLLADRLWLLRAHKGISCGVTEDLILDHQLDDLFPTTNIRFDENSGSYAPRHEHTRTIILEAADDRLRHWTENALLRQGYTCLSQASPTQLDIPKLTVNTPHQLILQTNTEKCEFTSYESLIRKITQE